jgi:gas vesicle protein GvpA/GvpJ/GvpM family
MANGADHAPAAGQSSPALAYQRIALVDLLDRLLAGGVVISGDVTLAIADVDLVTISLRALIASVTSALKHGAGAGTPASDATAPGAGAAASGSGAGMPGSGAGTPGLGARVPGSGEAGTGW